jgi:eukaryotic-like serine/threonine-protein kinase
MGEVYRARDTRLGRDVALKVLREKDSQDSGLLLRFDQEARAASSLNHPNIVVVYETGSAAVAGHAEPIHYLAMELIEGEPLNSLLTGEPVPVGRMLDIAAQLTDGLARAHESGIVHRDLKPSNIFVDLEGRVKILDFGLAKLRAPAEKDTESPTEGEALTSPGVVVGTVGYMSPEQARGEPATAASDQFSVGCILYEMLTARPAFARGSAAETLSSILRDEPTPIERLNPGVPAPVRWVVGRCLAKSARDRYVSTRDLARDVRMLAEHLVESGVLALPLVKARRSRFRVATAAALLSVAVAAGLLLSRQLITPLQAEFRRLTFRQGVVSRALFAPNGSILYSASWERKPARSYLALSESSGIDRLLESEIQMPLAFSEDGSQVLVLLGTSLLSRTARGTLAWWPSLGGKARRILDDAGWADAAKRAHLLAVVRVAGGERILELRSAEGELRNTLFRTSGAISFVRFAPNERQVAFIHHPSRDDDAGEVRIAAIDGSGSKPLTRRFERCLGLDWNERSGTIWFSAVSAATDTGSALWTVTPTGKARLRYVLPGSFYLQSVSAAEDRWLLTSDENRVSLSVRRNGEPPNDLSWFAWTLVRDISPDGRMVLFYDSGPTENTSGMWIRSIEGGDATRLQEGFPEKFSPDGQWIVGLPGPTSRGPRLVLVPVGAGRSRSLSPTEANISAPSFIDARTLLFVRRERGRSEVWRMDIASGQSRPLGARDCDLPRASPSRTAFVCVGSADSRTLFIHFLDGRAGRKLFELPEGEEVIYIRWNGTGERIFVLTRAGQLLTVDAATGTLLHQEAMGGSGATLQDRLIAAALDAEGKTRAYSVNRLSSSLYLAAGLR